MNHVQRPHAISFDLVAAVTLTILSLGLIGLALVDCTPNRQAPPSTDPSVYTDASDASALLDAGSHPSDCALMCASWAAGQCRAATPNCIAICDRETRADGFYSPNLVHCVVGASGAHDKLHACNARACP